MDEAQQDDIAAGVAAREHQLLSIGRPVKIEDTAGGERGELLWLAACHRLFPYISLIAATPSAPLEPSQNTQMSSPTGAAKLSRAEVMTRFRSMMASRYRAFAPLARQ
jgi:hypothetical protein